MANKQVQLKQVENGSTLYHYTKSNGINGIVNHNCFWATKSDFLNDPNEFSYIRRILADYLPEVLQLSLDEILEAGMDNRDDVNYQKVCRKFQKTAAVYAMFFKHEAFAQEQEYRFVFKKSKETQIHFREKDGFLIPYIEIQLSEAQLPVEEIVVAPQNHIDLAKNGMEYMMANKGYHVKVSLSDIKLRY